MYLRLLSFPRCHIPFADKRVAGLVQLRLPLQVTNDYHVYAVIMSKTFLGWSVHNVPMLEDPLYFMPYGMLDIQRQW